LTALEARAAGDAVRSLLAMTPREVGIGARGAAADPIVVPLVSGPLPDFATFTRNMNAFQRMPDDANGERWQRVGATHLPRFHCPDGTLARRGLLVEPLRKNYAYYTEKFEQAPQWAETGSGVVVPNQDYCPDLARGVVADKIVDDDPATVERVYQDSMTLPLVACVASVFGYKVSGETGLLSFRDGIGGGNTVAMPSGSKWGRCWVVTTIGNADASYIAVYPGGATGDVAKLGQQMCWQAQVEEGEFPTSPIYNAAVQDTRPGDVCAFSVAKMGGRISLERGRFRYIWSPGFSYADATALHCLMRFNDSVNGSSNYLAYNGGGNDVRLYSNGLSVIDSSALGFGIYNSLIVIDVWWDGTVCGLSVWENGVKKAGSLATWTPASAFPNGNVYFGCTTAGDVQATGVYRALVIG